MTKANQTYDFDEHKRKIFFEHLSSTTTTDSLKEYLSGFDTEICVVPYEDGRNLGYGFVIFRKESSVNNIMSKRPHTIGGQVVELYRSVPDQGALKEKKGVKELIVSGFNKRVITKSDLENYFCGFGTIIDINMSNENTQCSIEFEDYDSVDKALLDRPHVIKNMKVDLKKGSRKGGFNTRASSKITQAATNNDTSPVQKKFNLKQVQIDSQVSAMNLPEKVYCVHVTNLPANTHAETLAWKFDWPMGNILIGSPIENQSAPVECWLKNFDDRREANDFIERWNQLIISGSKIDCEVQEDRLELCNKFRIGTCPKTSEVCDWEHIPCSAVGICSNDCPYGHKEGMKNTFNADFVSSDTYRLKVSGLGRNLTPDILRQLLSEKKCFINRFDRSIGYLSPLRTMKYAQRLLEKWHNKSVDGQTLKCQIECNPRPPMKQGLSSSGSIPNLAEKNSDRRRSGRSRQQNINIAASSRDSSATSDNNNSGITTINDQDINCEGRLAGRSFEGLVKQRNSDIKRGASSKENVTSFGTGKSWSFDDLSKDGRKMTKVESSGGRDRPVFLIAYDNVNEEAYRTEIDALKVLKGVQGVIQLIEQSPSDNDRRQLPMKNNFCFLGEYTPGCTLKKFIDRMNHGGVGVLEAVQLAQNLVRIVEEVHSKDVLCQNLQPESILIDWDPKQTSIDEAQLVLINFSQAHIKSEKITRMNRWISKPWYKVAQADVELFKYSSTIDASSICGILLWLLTNTDPQHDQDIFPHQQDTVSDKLDNKISQAVRNANATTKQQIQESQLKNYLIDTFNMGFGYPEYRPWLIGDLKCRLESIRELLLPRNRELNSTAAIFEELASTYTHTVPAFPTNTPHDIFQKAAMAFQTAKTKFSDSNRDYIWSDGGCTWMDSSTFAANERRHDDILTYEHRDRRTSVSCSVIISCLATLVDRGNCLTLSISSVVNGKMSRVPIGRYSKTQHFNVDVEKNFITEIGNLIKSITKERRTKIQ